MRLVAAAILATLVVGFFAGCVEGPEPDPSTTPRVTHGPGFEVRQVDSKGLPRPYFLCHEPLDAMDSDQAKPVPGANKTRCNFEMTPDAGRAGNEVGIAVNPKDPRNVVGAAKDYFPEDAGECVWDGIYVTHDGAKTAYQDRSLDGSPWRQLNEPDPSKINYATQFWCTTDPVVYFDVNGRFYYLAMAYQADRVTGSKTCEEECPNGALNDWAFNRATQIVAVSNDGGDTFETFQPIFEGTYPVAFNDKGWIAASDNGVIHVGWSMFPEGNVYFRSTDDGQTFVGPVLLSSAAESPVMASSGFGSYVNVGPGPEVYYSWAASSDGLPAAGFARSFDYGETWEQSHYAFTYPPFEIPNGLSPRDRRGLYQWPVMATDREKDSPFSGAIYFVYPAGTYDEAGTLLDGSDIYFRASFDKGNTWTEPVKLNDDPLGSYQFLPAVSVNPGGVLDVTWFDQRNDPGQYLIDQYYTYSIDGGKTWATNFRARDADDFGWDPQLSKHQNGMVFLGDYIGISSSWQAAHPVWTDGRSEVVGDVYTATIQRPMFADGYPAEKRAAADAWIRDHPLS